MVGCGQNEDAAMSYFFIHLLINDLFLTCDFSDAALPSADSVAEGVEGSAEKTEASSPVSLVNYFYALFVCLSSNCFCVCAGTGSSVPAQNLLSVCTPYTTQGV